MDGVAIGIGVVCTVAASVIIPGIVLTAPRWFPVRKDLRNDPIRLRRRVIIGTTAAWLFAVSIVWIELIILSST